MSLQCEIALLNAVKDSVFRAMQFAASKQNVCEVELDEECPAIAGDKYITITPGGLRPGPKHDRMGGALDYVIGCKVTVFHRTGNQPRDRRGSHFLDVTSNLNADLERIVSAIDFQYQVIKAANTSLGDAEGFLQPLIFGSLDAKPTPVYRDTYAAAAGQKLGDPILALKRGITFNNARYLRTR